MQVPRTISSLRNRPVPPGDADYLWRWVRLFLGVGLAREAVCLDHVAPFEAFARIRFDIPSLSLILGPRGAGKSMMSAFHAHMDCRFHPGYAARIMGGSREQSKQVYDALRNFVQFAGAEVRQSDRDQIKQLLDSEARYINGSVIRILAASTKAGRGPHVPGLFLDEIDEMDRDVFDSAIGMSQDFPGKPAKVVMTSTWHNEYGIMSQYIEKAKESRFPFFRFCTFEVLERCPPERSGDSLEKCPECPIVKWCHEDIDRTGLPKAKRSNGHYTIESFIQKAMVLSERMIEADYLSRGPRIEGIWFRSFSPVANVAGPAQLAAGIAEFHPEHRTYLPIDYGVCTGAVAFQRRHRVTPHGTVDDIHVFGDYYSDGLPAAQNAIEIRKHFEELMKGRSINDENVRVTMDPAGGTRDPIGPTGISEYARSGIRRINWWPVMSHRKRESLDLLESFVADATGTPHLFIHPRCKHLISALQNYRRRKVGQVFLPEPDPTQHPFEDLVDSLAGGLLDLYPHGRAIPDRVQHRRRASILHG